MSNPNDLRLRRFWPLVIGVVELVVLVRVATWIGLGWAILLLLMTSLAGFALLRLEGFRAWAALREAAASGQIDAGVGQIADTGVRILAGLLLTVPGFVTDLAAVVLLVPPVRRRIGRRLSAAAFRTSPTHSNGGSQHHSVVIEGEVIEHGPGERPYRGDDSGGTPASP